MEGFKFEHFIAGMIVGMAIRSTDLLPVTIGFALGHYVTSKNIDMVGSAMHFVERFILTSKKEADK